MDKNKIAIGVVLLIAFVGVLMYLKNEKEKKEEEERKRAVEAGEIEDICTVLTFDQFELEKRDWYWWLRRSSDQLKREAVDEFYKDEDNGQLHPSYRRWALNKMDELGFCQEDV